MAKSNAPVNTATVMAVNF